MTDFKRSATSLSSIVIQQGSIEEDLDTLRLKLVDVLCSENEGAAVVVSGDSGSGKTTLLCKFAERSIQYLEENMVEGEIVNFRTPTAPVGKGLYTDLLMSLGAMYTLRSDIESKTEIAQKHQIKELIKNKNIKVLIFDEFQHVTEKMRDSKMRQTADFLKTLITEFQILLVFAGTHKVEAILNNEQFASRAELIEKKLMCIKSKKGFHEFQDYLASLQKHSNFGGLGIENAEYALPIYYQSRGDLRRIKSILTKALLYADMKKSKTLSRRHFVESCGYVAPEVDRKYFKGNPWKQSTDVLIEALKLRHNAQ